MEKSELSAMINRAYDIKQQIDNLSVELKDLNAKIYEEAVFADGKKTTYLAGDGLCAKIVKKENRKWDQGKLNIARMNMGDEKFLTLFNFEWKPKSAKDIDGFLGYAPDEQKKPILEALTTSTSYTVTVAKEKAENA